MIKVLMLDLGKTLIDKNNKPFPGVQDALGVLENFETAEHKPLVTCLVSDFDKTFDDYLAILDQTGLRGFFEPVDERVTLSIHAKAEKPDAKVFETALKRAKVHGSIKDALFITEEKKHVEACRDLGMTALQFGEDFKDWSAAPMLIAQKIGAPGTKNSEAALKPLLAAHHGLQLQSIDSVSDNRIRGTARNLVKLEAPELGSLDGVHVEMPVDLEARIDSAGKISAVQAKPRADDIAEAVLQVQTLTSNKQISGDPTAPTIATHSVETDAEGRRVLRRRRFTAF
jgi:hypothetical protein